MLMLSEPHRDLVRDKGTKLGRILIGLLFFSAGASTLLTAGGIMSNAAYFESLSLPAPVLLTYAVVALKIVAGGAIIIGKRVGLAAAALIGFTLLATMIAHRSFEDINLFKNLAIVGGLLYLMAYGPGGHHTGKLATKSE